MVSFATNGSIIPIYIYERATIIYNDFKLGRNGLISGLNAPFCQTKIHLLPSGECVALMIWKVGDHDYNF